MLRFVQVKLCKWSVRRGKKYLPIVALLFPEAAKCHSSHIRFLFHQFYHPSHVSPPILLSPSSNYALSFYFLLLLFFYLFFLAKWPAEEPKLHLVEERKRDCNLTQNVFVCCTVHSHFHFLFPLPWFLTSVKKICWWRHFHLKFSSVNEHVPCNKCPEVLFFCFFVPCH